MIPWWCWPPMILGGLSALTCAGFVGFVVLVESRENHDRLVEDREVARLEDMFALPSAVDGPGLSSVSRSRRRRGF